ncbi:MAG: hypothetical protein BBJ57_05890 [Desulfobacterales bacterium PC51MH44]|nr:MAG: hypothetical protein BBJ57_05890 [Desulfobacterales bacterium PC51MH44]
MLATKSRKFPLKYILILLGIAVIIILMSISMARTSTTEYCVSCHEMERYKDELEKSSHAVDKDKNPIQCRQCHIPKNIGPKYLTVKTVLGLKDLIVHNFGNPEDLDRREMQKIGRRFIPDENCLACHQDLTKDVKDKELSEIGKLCHEAYQGKNGTTKRGCAGCHFNMAHLPQFDRRFFFNAEFAKRLPLQEEQK